MAEITQTGLYPRFIDLARKKSTASHAASGTSEERMIDQIREGDPEKADALVKQLNDYKQISAQLKNGKSSAAQSKKAEAAEKIKRIKAEIQMIKTMGGDPKLVARQIARLARELATAVHDYASAGATPLEGAEAGSSAEMSSDNNAGRADSAAGNEATAPATPNVAALSESADTSPPAATDQTAGNYPSEPDAVSKTTSGFVQVAAAKQYSEVQRQQFKGEVQKEADKIKASAAQTKADQEFALEARTQAALLKILARQIKERLSRKRDSSADADLEQPRQALAEVEKTLSGMTGNLHLAV